MNTSPRDPSVLGRVLSAFGIVVVAGSLVQQFSGLPPVLLSLAYLAVAGWAAFVVLPRRYTGAGSLVLAVMVVAGSVATAPTYGLLIVTSVVAILTTVGTIERPLWHGAVLAALAAVIIPLGALLADVSALGVLSMEGGVVLAVIGGLNRRQLRIAEEQRARGAALAERQSVARDIHDVLAHSLGGLVVQLDAVDALLEAGRTDDAATRVRAARVLAASGLAEARRAVDVLRDDRAGAVTGGADLALQLDDLVRAHRALDGVVTAQSVGSPVPVPGQTADALRRALQEALTNARKHAPDAPVSVSVHWETGGIVLEVRNSVGAGAGAVAGAVGGAHAGRGHGLDGMRERFAAIGGTVEAGVRGSEFVVAARVRLP